MDTTKDLSVRFDPMADNTAIAVRADRRQCVDCALEAVEDVTLSTHDYFKRLVILVFANFAFRHTQVVRARGGSRRCFIIFPNEFRRHPGITVYVLLLLQWRLNQSLLS